MGRLLYIASVSVDGFIEDPSGSFDWAEPDDGVFAFITDLIRPVSTHLLGRRMYETVAVWETDPSLAAESDLMRDFAEVWQAADKVVYSTTLGTVSTASTVIERTFDADAVHAMKASVVGDLVVSGPTLAAPFFEAGLVDECQLFVHPVAVGGGKPGLPTATEVELELLDERRFDGGVVYLRYRVKDG